MSMDRVGEISNKAEARNELYALLGKNSDHQLIDDLVDECRRYEQVINAYQEEMKKRESKRKPNYTQFNEQSYDARNANNRPQPRRGRGGYDQSQNTQRDQYRQNNQQRGSRNSQYYYTPGQQSQAQLSKNSSSNAPYAKTPSGNRVQNRSQNRNAPYAQQNNQQGTNKPQNANAPPPASSQQQQQQQQQKQENQLEQKQVEKAVQPPQPQPVQTPSSNQQPQQQIANQSPQSPSPQETPVKTEPQPQPQPQSQPQPQPQPKITTLYIPSNLAKINASINIFGTFAGPLPPPPAPETTNAEPSNAKVQLSDLTSQEQIYSPSHLEIKNSQTVESPHQEEEQVQPNNNQPQIPQAQFAQQQMMQPAPFGQMYPPYYFYPGQYFQPMQGQPANGDLSQGGPIPIPIQQFQHMPSSDADPNQPPIQQPIPVPVFIPSSYGYYPAGNVGIPYSQIAQPQANNVNTQNQPPQQP